MSNNGLILIIIDLIIIVIDIAFAISIDTQSKAYDVKRNGA